MSPATARCASTASRAISRCMISVEPSKMRLMRMSRSICSAGTARLAARGERLGGLEAASAADLHQLVGDQPAHLRAVELGQRRLDPDVVAPASASSARQLEHRLEPEGRGGDEGDLAARHGFVLTDRPAPLHPLAATTRGRSSGTTWPRPRTIAGSDSRPVLSVDSAIFRPSPSLPMRFSVGYATLSTASGRSRCRVSPMNALRFSTAMPSASASHHERA